MYLEDRGGHFSSVPHLSKRSSSNLTRSRGDNSDLLRAGTSHRLRSGEPWSTPGNVLGPAPPTPADTRLGHSHLSSAVPHDMPPPYTAVEGTSSLADVASASSDAQATVVPGAAAAPSVAQLGDPAPITPAPHRPSATRAPHLAPTKASREASASPAPSGPHALGSLVPSFLSRMRYLSAVEAKRAAEYKTDAVEALEPLPVAFMVLLHSLRLFAAVPGILGTYFSFKHGMEEVSAHHWIRTPADVRRPGALEHFICCTWALCTAFHALSLMTLLLRRWLIYYAVLPSVIRLVAFQSICWSLVRCSLYLFGSQQPVGGWVFVSSFTALMDVVVRWITSNITDVDETEHDAPVSDYPDTGASDAEGLYSAGESSSHPALASGVSHRRYARYREQSVRLFRVIVGGPSADEDELSESDTSETDTKSERTLRRRFVDSGLTATESDVSSSTPYPRMDPAEWRRRVDARRSRAHRSRTERSRRRRRAKQNHLSSFFQNYRAARIHSRRVFHWEVAMWRNLMPIAVLGYIALWALLMAHYWHNASAPSP